MHKSAQEQFHGHCLRQGAIPLLAPLLHFVEQQLNVVRKKTTLVDPHAGKHSSA